MGSLIINSHGIAAELAQRGHEVYSALSDEYLATPRAKVPLGINVIQFHMLQSGSVYTTVETSKQVYDAIFAPPSDFAEDLYKFARMEYMNCYSMMKDEKFLMAIRGKEFDFVVADALDACPCLLIVPAYLDVPFAIMSSELSPDMYRIPFLPSFVGNFYNEVSDQMTFWERLENTIFYIVYAYYTPVHLEDDRLLETYATPKYKELTWIELARKVEIIIYPRSFIVDWPEPMMPHIINIPGVVYPSKPLPAHLEKIINGSADNGVIIMTFGTTLRWMPQDIAEKFIRTFSEIKQTVIWRVETDVQLANIPPNVHVYSWIPQTDLLANHNTKLFITHGGKWKGAGSREGIGLMSFILSKHVLLAN